MRSAAGQSGRKGEGSMVGRDVSWFGLGGISSLMDVEGVDIALSKRGLLRGVGKPFIGGAICLSSSGVFDGGYEVFG